jgi:hypothetical protein
LPAGASPAFLGDDVDHAGEGVGAVEGGSRAVEHFDLLGEVEGEVLGDLNLAAGRVVDAHAVEQDQQLVVADVPLEDEMVVLGGPGAALEVDAGQVFEQIGEVLVAPVAHLFAGDHHDVGRRALACFGPPRGGGDRGGDQFIKGERQQGQHVVGGRPGLRRERPAPVFPDVSDACAAPLIGLSRQQLSCCSLQQAYPASKG